ncbi:MAG TPA: GAF domain-containing sensor histidine kinase, partial [Chloroflexi bacterium]|nr:GAF domain-containing sensor histidine kinase [Chloroflexota bacterium]
MTESKRKEDVIPFPSPRSGLESQVVDTDYGVSGGRYTEKALLQALEALRRRNYELALLQRASQAFNSTLELDQVLAAVLEEVRLLLNAVACSVWLVDSETGQLICWQATGVENEVVRGWQLAPGEGIVGWVAQSGRVLIVPDAREDDRHFKEIDEQTGLEMCAILSVPLETKGQVIGVLQVLDTEVNRFSPIDLTLLEPLAAAAATAIDNARLVEALRQRTHDLERRNDELDAFAQTVAHDLKIPLGYIVGFAEALRECGDGMEFEDICHHLQTIAWSGRKMEEIVDELLLLAGVRSAEVELQPLDMAGIVAQAQERLSGLIAKHQAKIVHP